MFIIKYITYKLRVYPNKKQKTLLAKTFGSRRFVYNYYLTLKIEKYKTFRETLSYYACCNDLTNLKQTYKWLKEIDSTALQSSIKDLERAYRNFFRGDGFPKFKSKKVHKYSYRSVCSYNNIRYKNKHVKIPKIGWLKTKQNPNIQGKILNATILQTPDGCYYVNLCCETEIKKSLKTDKNVGLDLGIKDFCITSNGDKYKNPKYLNKSFDKLAKLQRQLSRKTKGSNNYNKTRIKIAKLHAHISNQRKDFTQKLSTKLISENDIICIEDLQIKNMIKNHRFARNIIDVSWSRFIRELEYKASWHERIIVKIDKFYPSSQLCNCCGYQYSPAKDLTIRFWKCPNCGNEHDRDVNAAKNILKEGLRVLSL